MSNHLWHCLFKTITLHDIIIAYRSTVYCPLFLSKTMRLLLLASLSVVCWKPPGSVIFTHAKQLILSPSNLLTSAALSLPPSFNSDPIWFFYFSTVYTSLCLCLSVCLSLSLSSLELIRPRGGVRARFGSGVVYLSKYASSVDPWYLLPIWTRALLLKLWWG